MSECIELSVVVPVYNVEKYLRRCLDSILQQTYCVGEIICVNDGSTDGCAQILEEYAEKDDRIRIVWKENGGLVSARKAGIMLARGQYATYVDSDDWIEPNMYAEMMQKLMDSDADIVTSGCIRDFGTYIVREEEKVTAGIYEGDGLIRELQSRMVATDKFFQANMSIHIYNKIYRTALLKKYQRMVDDKINLLEDAACAYPCLLNAKKVAVMGKSYYHYCVRGDSIMGTMDEGEKERYQILFDYLSRAFGETLTRVSNAMQQFTMLYYYAKLFRCADEVVEYRNNLLIPYGELKPGERVVIYGAGKFSMVLKPLLEKMNFCEIVAWVDKKTQTDAQLVEILQKSKYDKIMIAVLVNEVVEQIKKELSAIGIAEERILSVDYRLFKEL